VLIYDFGLSCFDSADECFPHAENYTGALFHGVYFAFDLSILAPLR
jgi:hypothetical protein